METTQMITYVSVDMRAHAKGPLLWHSNVIVTRLCPENPLIKEQLQPKKDCQFQALLTDQFKVENWLISELAPSNAKDLIKQKVKTL